MQRFLTTAFAAALLLSVPQAFASTVWTSETKTFRPNAGIVEIPAVNVADQPGMPGSLSGATSFTLVLSSEANVRLAKASALSASVTGGDVKIAGVSDDLRSVRFVAASPLPSGVSLSISGLKAVIYNRYSSIRGLDLDVGSDGTIDALDPNGIRVNEEYGTQDVTAPHEPLAVTGAFFPGSVIVSALPSADIDFEQFRVSLETLSGASLSSSLVTALSSRSFDLPLGANVVRVQSVDNRGNVSEGVTFRNPAVPALDTTVASSGSSSPVEVSTGTTLPPKTLTGTL